MGERYIRIFGEKDADSFLRARLDEARRRIRAEAIDYILNVGEEEYVSYICSAADPGELSIDFASRSVSEREAQVPGMSFPPSFDVRRDEMYKVQVIRYHVPYNGNPELLTLIPNPRIHWTQQIPITDVELMVDIHDFFNNPDDIKSRSEEFIGHAHTQLESLQKQLSQFRSKLASEVRGTLAQRKQQILDRRKLLSALDVPIRVSKDSSGTFSVPIKPSRITVEHGKPRVEDSSYKPEPTLGGPIYESILTTVMDMGRQLERMPSTYEGKDEEALRDHFLLILEPKFEGTATGETFNRVGKTDILLRHEGHNIFIAECKFWRGPKQFSQAINQLLGYLTWRDSKAAIVLFVRNKDFTSVLKSIEEEAPKHSNFLRFVKKHQETRFDYRFHLQGDRNREVRLAVLAFHLPSVDKSL